MFTLAPLSLKPISAVIAKSSPLTLNSVSCSYPIPKLTPPVLKFRINCEYQTERGLEFETGGAFYRQESVTCRDLGILAASLHKKCNGSFRVLDALCGCGIRSLRYLVVGAIDGNENYGSTIINNLSRATNGLGNEGENERRWLVTHLEANRVMMDYYLRRSLILLMLIRLEVILLS